MSDGDKNALGREDAFLVRLIVVDADPADTLRCISDDSRIDKCLVKKQIQPGWWNLLFKRLIRLFEVL